MSAQDWTEERVNLLKVLWAQGVSCSHIAKRIGAGFSRNAVIGKVSRLGLTPRAKSTRAVRTGKAHAVWLGKKSTKPKPRLSYDGAKPKGALRGPQNVKFIARDSNQCPMFCEGEEGPDGLVCGLPVQDGNWCEFCSRIVYQPAAQQLRARKAA